MVEFVAALKVRVAPAMEVKLPPLLKFPVMLRLAALLMISDPPAAMNKFPQTSPAAFTVIVNPAGIMTLSDTDGTVPKDQFAAVSQAPVNLAVLTAIAKADINSINSVSELILWWIFFNKGPE